MWILYLDTAFKISISNFKIAIILVNLPITTHLKRGKVFLCVWVCVSVHFTQIYIYIYLFVYRNVCFALMHSELLAVIYNLL